jgi:hypothetical protein
MTRLKLVTLSVALFSLAMACGKKPEPRRRRAADSL